MSHPVGEITLLEHFDEQQKRLFFFCTVYKEQQQGVLRILGITDLTWKEDPMSAITSN